jgi:hypothetical protein
MTGPWGVLPAGSATTTIEVEDIDGGLLGGCWLQGLAAATTEVEDVDGGPPRGCWRHDRAAATTDVEDIDDGPPGGAKARDLGRQRVRSPPLGQGGEWLQKPRDKCSNSS